MPLKQKQTIKKVFLLLHWSTIVSIKQWIKFWSNLVNSWSLNYLISYNSFLYIVRNGKSFDRRCLWKLFYNPVLFNTGLSCSSSSADNITVQLHDQFNPSIEFSEKRLMDINNQSLNLPVVFSLLGRRIRGWGENKVKPLLLI